jgi:pantoate--beta-alanine ligase
MAAVETIESLRRRLAPLRRADATVGFVPTMGALHAGHASLMDRARRECGAVVVSIFVNPLQFDRADDLARYPRTLEADLEICAAHGVDVVFTPDAREMYPSGAAVCTVDPGSMADHCCGRYRAGHFRGVATVVAKLLNIVQPEVAYFGEKDAQQLAVIRRLVLDLNLPVTIVGVPTVREEDGLALSSRNVNLDAEERRLAPSLYAALQEAAVRIESGMTEPSAVRDAASARLPRDERLRLEYLEIVDPDRFQPVARIDGDVIVAAALWVGSTRLIDNVRCARVAR